MEYQDIQVNTHSLVCVHTLTRMRTHTYTQTVPDWSTLFSGPGEQERDRRGRRCGGAEERTLRRQGAWEGTVYTQNLPLG